MAQRSHHPNPIMDCRLPPVSSLMSPPEAKPFDSFSPSMRSSSLPQRPSSMPQDPPSDCFYEDNRLPPIQELRSHAFHNMTKLLSPPVSPYDHTKKKVDDDEAECSDTIKVKDPQLFSKNDTAALLPLDQPLFPAEQNETPQSIIDNHLRYKSNIHLETLEPPTNADYLLALSCVPIVSKNYNRNPSLYYQRERAILDQRFGNAHRISKVNRPLAKIAPALAGTPQKTHKRASSRERIRAPRQQRTPKSTPPSRYVDSFDDYAIYSTPKPSRVIGQSREDTDYNSLPDYCPPFFLPGNSKALKADWRGQVLDLSNDPDRHLLPEVEVNLAATLRLSCATYLCSKRRIFEARVEKLRKGKDFRKTDAQQACRIDVNKASKLWTAFDKAEWFNPSLFKQYL